MRRWMALFLVLALFFTAAACSSGDDSGDGERSSSRNDDDNGDGGGSGFDLDFGGGSEEDLSNEEVTQRVQAFWQEHAAEVGLRYEPVPEDRITAIPPEDGRPAPACDGFTVTPADVEGNAFGGSCGEGLIVVWDPNLVDGTLTEQFGEAGPAVVFSHEWGHVIQAQLGVIGTVPTVVTETEADCYAGAFVAEQMEQGWGPFSDPGSLDDGIGAMIFIRDPAGTSPDTQGAHGNGFDRVTAFQDGIDHGVGQCATYIQDPPDITELPFSSEEEAANQGNLPFDEVVDLVEMDLDDYFTSTIDGFTSPTDPFAEVDEDGLRQLHADVGDGTVATVLGLVWAQAVQDTVDSGFEGDDAFLQRACITGAWLGDILDDQGDGTVDRESQASLSPGDLDEAIITFIQLAEQDMSAGGTAFQAVRSMRAGVYNGLDACRL